MLVNHKNKERIQKSTETGDSRYIYQNELYKGCSQHDMTYGYLRLYKDLTTRTAYDKKLGNKAFDIAINTKYDGYQKGPASMVYKLFDKKNSGGKLKKRIFLIKN